MFDPYKYSDVFKELERELKAARAPLNVSGSLGSDKILITKKLLSSYGSILFICADEKTAEDYRLEAGDNARVLLAKDLLFNNLNTRSRYLKNLRIEVLKAMIRGEGGIVFAPVEAVMDPVPGINDLRNSVLTLKPGLVIPPGELATRLTALSYERTESVESEGEFALRGGIMDIFPVAQDEPVRLEFFDDEIESLKRFNTYSQRTTAEVPEEEIYPLDDTEGEKVSFLDYFGEDSLIVADDLTKIIDKGLTSEEELIESYRLRKEKGLDFKVPEIIGAKRLREEILRRRTLIFTGLDEGESVFKSYTLHAEAAGRYKGSFELLTDALRRFVKEGYRISLMTPSLSRASRIAEELRELNLPAYCPDERSHELKPGGIEVVTGSLKEGFIYPGLKYALMTENDMFGRSAVKRRRKKSDGVRVGALSELRVGDYLVHETYGIGIYRGIEHMVRDGAAKDYLKIEYADGGNLYLPATRLDLIQKYSGGDGKKVKLNRLNGTEWARTREKVAKSVEKTARELVDLYAARLKSPGYRYEKDSEWQKEFEEMFPFEETPDQAAAIEDVKRDMESGRIMDRLICGDVGYGKTEIAMRAAFKAAAEGKQTAMLVPTTILANQHYRTFTERFEKFPVRIGLLSRMRDSRQNRETAQKLSRGEIDIVIGTHRLLSGDVGFKDLGLLIVDEEQRFGVQAKEKIKELKHNVEALSLTATPIPRTLNMSLAGIRDLSVLNEPPFDRVPIETYVLEYNDEYVREAAVRELKRGGQVFYVFNRVGGIEKKCEELRALLPGVNIEYAHGQMAERELEGIMADFVGGGIDILVSTTIIESGLDIPRANTIIVDGAENMGLSQLYQLRGRVGRSSRTAYAFFMYRREKILKEEAEKRLKAIREFTGFGSGIKIALRDLEIRGAGNVLGTEQHGDIGAVGYDLYCKLLNEALREQRGLKEKEEDFETVIDCGIDAFLPDSYIADEGPKLEIYKKIAQILTPDDYGALLDEMRDRFGNPPPEAVNLMDIALLRARAHRAYVTELKIGEGSIVMNMFVRARIHVEKIPKLIEEEEGRLRLITGMHPRFIYTEQKGVRRDTAAMIKKAGKILSKLSFKLD